MTLNLMKDIGRGIGALSAVSAGKTMVDSGKAKFNQGNKYDNILPTKVVRPTNSINISAYDIVDGAFEKIAQKTKNNKSYKYNGKNNRNNKNDFFYSWANLSDGSRVKIRIKPQKRPLKLEDDFLNSVLHETTSNTRNFNNVIKKIKRDTAKDPQNILYEANMNKRLAATRRAQTKGIQHPHDKDVQNIAEKIKLPTNKKSNILSKINKIDRDAVNNLGEAKNAFKSKNFKSGFKSVAKASLPVAASVGLAAGAGVGTTALLNKLDKNNDKDEDQKRKARRRNAVIGGMVTSGILLDNLATKSLTAPYTAIPNIVKDTALKHPMRQAKGSKNETVKTMAGIAENIGKKVQGVKTAEYYERAIEKVADERSFAKKVLIDDFIGSGVRNLPETLAASAALYGASKLAQNRIRKKYNKQKSNSQSYSKETVTSVSKIASEYFSDDFKKKIKSTAKSGIESAARGAGKAIIPAAITLAIGRDITKGFDKIDREKYIARKSRDEILDDEMTREASEDAALDAGDVLKYADKSLRKIKGLREQKLQGRRVWIGPGKKQQFRYNY